MTAHPQGGDAARVRVGRRPGNGTVLVKHLVPRVSRTDLPPMIGITLIGGALAGAYGVVHDQFTYAISPEYFTKLKFNQFHYADLGLGDRAFVSMIGFLATWWVGSVAAWLLARRLLPSQPRARAYRQIRQGFLCVFACAATFALLGYALGLVRGAGADYSAWEGALRRLEVVDTWSFVRVACIHNAGYLGGLVGVVVALIVLRPVRTLPSGAGEVSTRATGPDVEATH